MQERPEHDDEVCPTLERPCFKCHLESLTLGLPSDLPTRTNYLKNPPKPLDDHYGHGLPRSRRPDGSEMPFLRADGDPMFQREFDQKKHLIDDNRRRIEATASAA